MFENLRRELGAMSDRIEVSVPIEADAEGYLDRECPAKGCEFSFKVLEEDWGKIRAANAAHCPMCRHVAAADHWFTTGQVEGARSFALAHMKGRLSRAMRVDARSHNTRQRPGSFVSMKLEVKGPPDQPLSPVAASEPMRLRATCDACGCRYSYIGSAFFCPSCGHNSASATFVQSMDNARRAAGIKAEFANKLDADTAETTARLLREKASADIVMSVQRLAERVWEELPGTKPVLKPNVFQRLDDTNALWLAATGKDLRAFLPAEDLARLKVHYQRRHLLAHAEGIVDPKYLSKSGDKSFAVGQRITVDETSLTDFVSLAERLGNALLSFLPDRPSSAAPPSPVSGVASTTTPTPTPTQLRRHGMSSEAEAVARVLAERSRHGRPMDPQVTPDDLREATSLTDDDIAEAVDELDRSGLVALHEALGMGRIGFHRLTPLGGLFEVFDPVLGLGDPLADARTIGCELLASESGSASASALAERLGWLPRRMNPAVIALVSRDLVLASAEIDAIWHSNWVKAKPGLRKFVRGGSA